MRNVTFQTDEADAALLAVFAAAEGRTTDTVLRQSVREYLAGCLMTLPRDRRERIHAEVSRVKAFGAGDLSAIAASSEREAEAALRFCQLFDELPAAHKTQLLDHPATRRFVDAAHMVASHAKAQSKPPRFAVTKQISSEPATAHKSAPAPAATSGKRFAAARLLDSEVNR